MEAYVDGKLFDLVENEIEVVSDVVAKVSSELGREKRIIKVTLDGSEITGNSEGHLKKVENVENIDITTGNASDLAMETIESITEFHQSLIAEYKKASDEFRIGNSEKSNKILADCMDGMKIFIRTTTSVASLLDINYSEIVVGDQNLNVITEKFSEILDEMIQAQTDRDEILSADLIEYELIPLLEDWAGALDILKSIGTAV
jgi:hypothetical protein